MDAEEVLDEAEIKEGFEIEGEEAVDDDLPVDDDLLPVDDDDTGTFGGEEDSDEKEMFDLFAERYEE